MKIFGSTKNSKRSRQLCAVSFLTAPKKLHDLAFFFEDHAKCMESSKAYGHAHLQDFDKALKIAIKNGEEPDLVIYQ